MKGLRVKKKRWKGAIAVFSVSIFQESENSDVQREGEGSPFSITLLKPPIKSTAFKVLSQNLQEQGAHSHQRFHLKHFWTCYYPVIAYFYFISLFFIRFIDKTKKKGVVIKNQERLSNRVALSFPTVNALVSATAWVNGKRTLATICASTGRLVMEKNVPLKMNIGVMKRKDG